MAFAAPEDERDFNGYINLLLRRSQDSEDPMCKAVYRTVAEELHQLVHGTAAPKATYRLRKKGLA